MVYFTVKRAIIDPKFEKSLEMHSILWEGMGLTNLSKFSLRHCLIHFPKLIIQKLRSVHSTLMS